MIPKEGEWSRANYRPITCMNTVYKAITTTLINPMNQQLEEHQLIQRDQRRACEGTDGTLDNLLIDKTVLEDARDHRQNMACAWVDVRKAYDSVDDKVLRIVLQMHKFSVTLINAIMKVVKGTSTRLTADTKTGKETSSSIHLKKALLQGDSLCPRLFTIYLNPLAWKIRTMKGYTLSKPIQLKITQLMFIDDIKLFTANERELYPALKEVKLCLKDLNMSLGNDKCAVMTVKRGEMHHNQALQLDHTTTTKAVQEDQPYKFLGSKEHALQDSRLMTEKTAKEFLQRAWLIWSSSLSDKYMVQVTTTFALPALTYHIPIIHWPVTTQLKELDRMLRKILNDTKAKHPASSNELLYFPRTKGGRGLKSVEQVYKETKIKTALHMHRSTDPAIKAAAKADLIRMQKGRRSIK